MSRRFAHSVAAAAAVFAFAAAPALAAAPPVYNVYVEQVPTASGPKPTASPKPTSSHSVPPEVYVPLSPTVTAKVQREGGKDRKLLKKVATTKALGAQHRVAAPSTPNERTPSAISAAFDLGSGPTVLFVVLLGVAALLLAVAGGVSRRRRSN